MLWIALHLPLLTIEAYAATLDGPADAPDVPRRPLALIADHRVEAVDEAAAERGIRPGMKRATALALASDLLVASADRERDAAALQAVAHAALAFTPAVALHDEQTVLMEVQTCLRLFGGLARLRERLMAALAPLGHRVQAAAAPTALGAALLARWPRPPLPALPPSSSPRPALPTAAVVEVGGCERVLGEHATQLPVLQRLLDGAPVGLMGPGREHWEALQGMGLHTLADLRSLPRDGVARRFGPALLDDLDRAFGLRPDLQRWVALPPRFESRLELNARADTTAQLLHAAGVLLARLVAWAGARQSRIAAYTLRMRHGPRRDAGVAATELRIELAEPALATEHLQLLLRERLARVELAAPTLELELLCSEVVAAPAPNGELFPTRASADEGLLRLVERLGARLGDDRVQRWLPVADHRPEHAGRVLPAARAAAADKAAPFPAAGAADGPTLHRPTWLLAQPQPLHERDAQPLLQGRALQLLSGPERIESGWWDGDPVARDYYIAQADDRSLVWVYRERIPRADGGAGWFLQGRFG